MHVAGPKCREVFFKLDEEARRTVLSEPLQEIALMLEQNLLHKFRLQYGIIQSSDGPRPLTLRTVGRSVDGREG